MSSLLFARSWSRHFLIKHSSLLSKPLRLTANVPTPLLNITGQYDCRYFSRKASKMGKHIEKLEELAHRPESEKAKEKKLKQNSSKQQHLVASDTTASEDHNPVASSEHDDDDVSFSSGNNNSAEGDDEIITLPTKDEVKSKMIKVVQALETSLRSVRGAEPTPELFDSVPVKVYGSTMPLNAVAQVVITGPSMAMISCFDPATASAVRDAIRDMEGMNFNPRMEENGTLAVPIPKVSVETRKSIVKQLNKIAEDNRQRIRRIRRAAQDIVKKGKDGNVKGISKDDAFRVGNQIDDVTEECIKAINDIVDRKSSSVMSF